MKIIIGLGNPEAKYIGTRHNVGFAVLDSFQKTAGDFSDFKEEKKLQATISEGMIGKEKVILVKPQAYYNESGMVTAAVLHYYKEGKANLLVIHDDLAMPVGKIRVKSDSSAGGNNGVKSIIQHLKSQDFVRIKIGIWSELKEKMDASDFVLGKFSAEEKKVLQATIEEVKAKIIELIGH